MFHCKMVCFVLALFAFLFVYTNGIMESDKQTLSLVEPQSDLFDTDTDDLNAFLDIDPLYDWDDQQAALEDPYLDAYHVEYKGAQKVSFKEAKIIGQVYHYGNPKGRFEVMANEEGRFLLDKEYGKDIALSISSIKLQDNGGKRCHGHAIPGDKRVVIHCE